MYFMSIINNLFEFFFTDIVNILIYAYYSNDLLGKWINKYYKTIIEKNN